MKKAWFSMIIISVCVCLMPITVTHSEEGSKTMESKESKYPSKSILENVPQIGYNIHLCPFPGSLYAYLKYIGEPNDYDYIMGITGAAFRRFWNRDDGGNVDLSYLGETPFKHIFNALGHEYQTIPAEKEAMIKAIKESINKGRPAISFGIIGPPEAGLVAGYDQDGKVFYGWSYFQDKKDKYYETSDWFETMDKNSGKGLVVVGDKKPRPSDREIFIISLKWAIDLERTAKRPDLPNHVSGLSAYEAWAAGLEVDADYPKDNSKILETRAMVHCDQCVMLEERHSAANFLRNMTKVVPEINELLNSSAKLYDEVADAGQYLWHWGHWMDPKVGQALADPKTRQEMAQHIRIAGKKEAQAVEYLEKALAILTKEKEPKFVDRDTFTVMGVLAQGDPRDMNFGEIWNRFMTYHDKVSPFSTDKVYYGVYFGPQGVREVDLVAGMAVKDVPSVPDGLVSREVPAMRCAVFECTMKTIGQTYDYIYREWIPKSQYIHDDKPDVELFPPNSTTPDSIVYIYIPIRSR